MAKFFSSDWIANGLVAGMFGTVAILFYFWFLEEPFLTYENIPFPPKIAQVYPGEIVPLIVERCNKDSRPRSYATTHSLMNVETGQPIILPDIQVMINPGCTTATSLINRVPPETPPGTYKVFGTAEVRGTLRSFHIEWYTQEFQVVPRPAPEKNKSKK